VRRSKSSARQHCFPAATVNQRAICLTVVGGFLGFSGFFNLHIAELFGVKDLATLQALDIFGVFVPGNDAYPGVLADGCHWFGIGWKNYSFRQIVSVFLIIWNGYLLNLLVPLADFFRGPPQRFLPGLETPTETVVY
jgi:hypothetical protein